MLPARSINKTNPKCTQLSETTVVNPILKQLIGVKLKDHIQGLPQGVSNNERILEYLRQSKIKEVQEE
eukprot:g24437.t1